MVDGLVEARPGIDLAAGGLDAARDLARPAPRGPLEEHVVVQMRESGLVGQLVRAADAHPDLDGDHRRRVVLFDQQRQPVGQRLSHG